MASLNYFEGVGAVDVAWAAGFLDGEGHLGVRTQKRSGIVFRYPVLEAAQVRTREPLDRLASMFGGTVRFQRGTAASRQRWGWSLSGGLRCRPALMALIPYLSAKRDEAETLLVLAMSLNDRGANQSSGINLKSEQSALAQAMLDHRRRAHG